MVLNCSHERTFFFVFQLSQCDDGLDLPYMPNVVVFSAGGYDDVFAPLLSWSMSVEMTVPMDQQGLLANSAGALFLAPRDMRKRLTEPMKCSSVECVV